MSTEKQSIISNAPFPRNYASEFLQLEKGEGVILEDSNGNRYLDFGSGIAVNALGHGRDDLAEIAYEQMKKLIHVSNLYTTRPAVELARKLTFEGRFDAVFFGNSGSEANETAIKLSRLYARRTRGKDCYKLLCFTNGFHGRTMGSLSCTPTKKYQEPFEPLLPGVVTAELNNSEALDELLDPSFAAVIVEAVQGEGGLESMNPSFAEQLDTVCKKHDIILIADEVQTGLGRTGTLLASEQLPMEPDIVTLAKPLAGGLPLSATLIPEKINDLLGTGEHGTTFGGGPVTAAIGSYVFDTISQPSFLEHVREKGEYMRKKLNELKEEIAIVEEIRGKGLLLGLALESNKGGAELDIAGIIARCREKGLLILRSGKHVLRIAPPLIISEDEIERGVEILRAVLQKET
jgi:acetylornithine/N-succinyldiaminopimelate aminotransferase